MKITPMPGKVLIEYLEPREKRSALVVPSTVSGREERTSGRIVAIGNPRKVVEAKSDGSRHLVDHPTFVQMGQYAVFAKHAADVMTIGSTQYFLVDENDILLVTDDAETFESLTL